MDNSKTAEINYSSANIIIIEFESLFSASLKKVHLLKLRWVVRLILYGGLIDIFLVPASAP